MYEIIIGLGGLGLWQQEYCFAMLSNNEGPQSTVSNNQRYPTIHEQEVFQQQLRSVRMTISARDEF